MIPGIDISHFQEIPDYSVIEKSGCGFCFIKATEGAQYVDPKLKIHATSLVKTHVLTGFYHFFLTHIDPVVQAQHFFDIITPYQNEYSLPPVIDLEQNDGNLSAIALHSAVVSFLIQLQKLCGMKPIIYTGKFFMKANLPLGGFNDYPLWDACYQKNPATPYGGWDKATFWQYTDKSMTSRATLTDGDLFMGTPEELFALTKEGDITKGGFTSAEWVKNFGIKLL